MALVIVWEYERAQPEFFSFHPRSCRALIPQSQINLWGVSRFHLVEGWEIQAGHPPRASLSLSFCLSSLSLSPLSCCFPLFILSLFPLLLNLHLLTSHLHSFSPPFLLPQPCRSWPGPCVSPFPFYGHATGFFGARRLQRSSAGENVEQMGSGWLRVSSVKYALNGVFVRALITILLL